MYTYSRRNALTMLVGWSGVDLQTFTGQKVKLHS